jgi:hypothetical protein
VDVRGRNLGILFGEAAGERKGESDPAAKLGGKRRLTRPRLPKNLIIVGALPMAGEIEAFTFSIFARAQTHGLVDDEEQRGRPDA